MVIRVPPPSACSATTFPPCVSATCRTIASPSPDPGMPRGLKIFLGVFAAIVVAFLIVHLAGGGFHGHS